jgi:hypothetical protein
MNQDFRVLQEQHFLQLRDSECGPNLPGLGTHCPRTDYHPGYGALPNR